MTALRTAACILTASAMALGASAEYYKVILPLGASCDGETAMLMNVDAGTVIETVTVRDLAARFEGQVDTPFVARVVVECAPRQAVFVLEPGTISFNATEGAFGSMLNDQIRDIMKRVSSGTPDKQAAALDSAIAASYDDEAVNRALQLRKNGL